MHIVSSSRSTILCDFPDLNTKCTYHPNDETNDFQFLANKRGRLLEVNKKSGLEFLLIRNVGEKVEKEILRLKKLSINNLYCVACPKQKNDEVALGFSSGQIKLLNHNTYELTHRFSADSQNSVIFMDYNASDEYLSSVYENGIINIFGMKTKTKTDTINFDRNVTLTRFNPAKRSHLSIASYKGSVYVYDINSKQKIFTSINCHTAPCRDLCMSPALPDVLLSVGYDCIMNIFDTRKKTQPKKIKYDHPLSTVCLSKCGNFFCIGNLKGELTSYDLRNANKFIASKKVHNSAIVRVAFVPNESDKNSSVQSCGNYSNIEPNVEARKSLDNLNNYGNTKRDSFCDFVEFQTFKGYDKMSTGIVNRDSFDWNSLNPRLTMDHRRSSVRPKISIGNPIMDTVEELSLIEGKENISASANPENIPVKLPRKTEDQINSEAAVGRLHNIREEKIEAELDAPFENSPVKANPPDKDIVENYSIKDIDEFRKLPKSKNSTPHCDKRKSKIHDPPLSVNQQSYVNDIEKLRSEMNERFNQLEFEMKFHADRNKWNIFTQNSSLHNEQLKQLEKVQNTLDFLQQTDPFVNEFLRIKKENESLKEKVLELSKKNTIG